MPRNEDLEMTTNREPLEKRAVTESRELERPAPRMRKIDCFGNPEIADRRIEHRGGRHSFDIPKAG